MTQKTCKCDYCIAVAEEEESEQLFCEKKPKDDKTQLNTLARVGWFD